MNEILSLCRERRGEEKMNKILGNDRLMLQYKMPLNQVILDFHDSLKSISSGYASFDYEDCDYQSSDIVKVISKNIIDEYYYPYIFTHCSHKR